MSMTLKGLGDVFRSLDDYHTNLLKEQRKALTRIGVVVKNLAVKYAPVITGNLRGSGYSRLEDDYILVGFGAFYAVFVHENMEGRSPKFLERAVNEQHQFILDELAKAHP